MAGDWGNFLALGSSRRQDAASAPIRAVSAFVLAAVACIAVLLILQDDRRGVDVSLLGGGAAKLDWNEFDHQLSHDWAGREQALKEGTSTAALAHEREEKEEKQRLLAQKRLEIKKIAEEKNIQRVERQIELEASNQLATHDHELSDAIVSSVPNPQVVFSGHFQPGDDTQSPGEAAAEMAAWGPNSNAAWSKILSAERIQQKAARRWDEEHPTVTQIEPKTSQQLLHVGVTSGQIEQEALHAEQKVHAAAMAVASGAKSQALSEEKAVSSEARRGAVAEEAGTAATLAKEAQSAAAKGAALVKEAVGEKKQQRAAAAGSLAPAAAAARGAQEAQESLGSAAGGAGAAAAAGGGAAELERQLAEEKRENQALQRLLVKVTTQKAKQQQHPAPPAPAVAPAPAPRQPLHSSELRCCDESCETLSEDCAALERGAAPAQPQQVAAHAHPTVRAAAAAHTPTASSARVSVAGMNKKQLEGLLASGDAAEKAAAAGALYNAYSAHLTVGAPASGQREAVKKATNDAMIKGPRRCCDTACVRVSTECPDTFAVDKAAIHAVAKGKGPTDAEMQEWLISGTQAQKDKAAAILYAEKEGKVSPPAPAAPKANANALAHATAIPSAAHHPSPPPQPRSEEPARAAVVPAPPASPFASQSAVQAQNIAGEAEGIVGGLAAEGH